MEGGSMSDFITVKGAAPKLSAIMTGTLDRGRGPALSFSFETFCELQRERLRTDGWLGHATGAKKPAEG